MSTNLRENKGFEVDSIQSVNEVSSGLVSLDDELFYCIQNVDGMSPFLVNLVSSTNHWMFIASNGALTAGRRNADNALFPYCTQDKLFELAHSVGSLSLFWLKRPCDDEAMLWEPFAGDLGSKPIERRLYKNTAGTKIVFEEVNRLYEVRFRYQWSFSETYGFVRTVTFENLGTGELIVRSLDGIQNLVPYGLDEAFLNQFSNLADAYKKSELLENGGIGVFYLSSIPTDKAEPNEGLKATVAWSPDGDADLTLLSSEQVKHFRDGAVICDETDIRGRRCAYLLEKKFELVAGSSRRWKIVAEINQDAGQIELLKSKLKNSNQISNQLESEIDANQRSLRAKVANSDGLQLTSDRLRNARHYSNTLFNIMRGGIPNNGYSIDVADFYRYLESHNRDLLNVVASQIEMLGSSVSHAKLLVWASQVGDIRLLRLAREYLPLTFSRRHGDPSRPWNKFSIETQDEEGNSVLAYQGNWRDIFQNWEPIGYSFPEYIESMITRFLNTSTADGYNPYKISRGGFDWETVAPDQAWSNIGYWGDHQIAYLQKLLEASERFHPGFLESQLEEELYVYSDIPYRIRSFFEIITDPRNTVDYDDDADAKSAERTESMGADGKLLVSCSGEIARANLVEKLLVPLLSKLSNFIPDGGIWMNTQRPEWNDANNALVGYGISVVTLCYTNRYLEFLIKLLERQDSGVRFSMDESIANLLGLQFEAFEDFKKTLHSGFDSSSRFAMMRNLGESGSDYRQVLYQNGITGQRIEVSLSKILGYLKIAQEFVGKSIDSNRRQDGLYHSYNLLRIEGDKKVEIDRLPEMLEGQVAALCSGRVKSTDAANIVIALRKSALYRADARSYILYPDRDLPTFLERNRVSESSVLKSAFLNESLKRQDGRILYRDVKDTYRFNGKFRNSGDLKGALLMLRGEYEAELGSDEISSLVELFEDVFEHRRFTGRSATFFAYEGLGSVYWHMVSKLLLSIQENCLELASNGERESATFGCLSTAYFETLAGLGFDKSPGEYGAFPLDAYSHTPKHAGAQQPGMTGQVKEDILSRWGELGVQVKNGHIRFSTCLLKRSEFLSESEIFEYIDSQGHECSVAISEDQLAFTFCQTLFVMQIAPQRESWIEYKDGEERCTKSWTISQEDSQSIFERTGSIQKVTISVPESDLLPY